MRSVPLSELASAVAGTLHGDDTMISAVSTDTRTLQPGDVYFALSGEQFDGNRFTRQAAEKGASAVVASDHVPSQTIASLTVSNPQVALAKLAGIQRDEFRQPLIAVTGSVGKTSTKEMLANILSCGGSVLSTSGNYNNEIGVPLTLLGLNREHQWAVVEMGAARLGDIQYLADFVRPDVALITTVEASHLESFGSMENIAAAKSEIYAGLGEEGIAVLNMDNPWTAAMREKFADRKQICFSSSDNNADVYASDIEVLSQPHDDQMVAGACRFSLHLPAENSPVTVTLAVPGRHMVHNALAAASCAVAVNFSTEHVIAGLESYQGVKQRMQVHSGCFGSQVIDDSYNANPASVRAAIDVLASSSDGNTLRVLILGTMGELGPDAAKLHAEIGEYARSQGIDFLYGVGQFSDHAVKAFAGNAVHFNSREECVEHCLQQFAARHDAVMALIKGSRSAGMETVVRALLANREDI